ncbi:MAG TPA: hypothetical protein VEY30_00850, partial [Myxococcaceae bacterium]|nr:hypothetical protein [Myxococcaceae bacterium]
NADAVGGTAAAGGLRAAATIAREELRDAGKAEELLQRAERADPDSAFSLRARLAEARGGDDGAALEALLARLAEVSQDAQEVARLRLELASHLQARGEIGRARADLESLMQGGRGAPGYEEALAALEPLYRSAGDHAALSRLLTERAQLLKDGPQAEALLAAADAARRAGDSERAVALSRQSVAVLPTLEGFSLLAELWNARGSPGKAAAALVQAAQLAPAERRAALLLDAAESWEAGDDLAEARALTERVASDFPDAVPAEALARRLLRLGASVRAAEVGFEPARGAANWTWALELADAAGDSARSREALWALAESEGGAPGERLEAELLAAGDLKGLMALGALWERREELDAAASTYSQVAVRTAPADVALEALERLTRLGREASVLRRALMEGGESPGSVLDEEVLRRVRTLPPGSRLELLEAAGGERLRGEVVLELLAEGYAEADRLEESARVLSLLPATPTRLRTRAGWALSLGREEESLALREQVEEEGPELEAVALDFLRLGGLEAATRVGTRLYRAGQLSTDGRRVLAERLASSNEGAALSAALWPSLLDADAPSARDWTRFGEALRRAGRPEEAQLAEGFGLALSGSRSAAPRPPCHPLSVNLSEGWSAETPSSVSAVDGNSMPRLATLFEEVLRELGHPEMKTFLNATGGPEAYLLGQGHWVLGAGALGVFGPGELAYLCALALALGEEGPGLRLPGEVADWEVAAVTAFAACPAPLAAARVLARLDPSVRGSDPRRYRWEEVLRASAAFRAVVRDAASRHFRTDGP